MSACRAASRRPRAALAGALCAALVLGMVGAAPALGQKADAPCASVSAGKGNAALVSATSSPGCARAIRMMREYLAGRIVRRAGPRPGQFTLKRYPGWSCEADSRDGYCMRGPRSASWRIARGMSATPSVVGWAKQRARPSEWAPFRIPRMGYAVVLTELRWSGWGGPQPAASGQMQVCLGEECETGPTRLFLTDMIIDPYEKRIVYACMRFSRTTFAEFRGVGFIITPSAWEMNC